MPYVEEGLGDATVTTPPLLHDSAAVGGEGKKRWLEKLARASVLSVAATETTLAESKLAG